MKQLLTMAAWVCLSFLISRSSFAQDKVYSDPEFAPEIVGGMAALASNICYPEEAKKNKIEGKVIVKVLLDEKGNVVKTEIEKKAHPLLDKAASDAVIKTKFIPGKTEGKAVKCELMIPVMFKLK